MSFARHRFTLQDGQGNAVDDPDALIKVTNEFTGAKPQLFADFAGATPLGNRFRLGDLPGYGNDGRGWFHAPGGFYRMDVDSEVGVLAPAERYVAIGTMAGSDFRAQWLPRGAWSGIVTYAAGDFVERSLANYVSNQAGNLNHEPPVDGDGNPTSDSFWTHVPAAGFVTFLLFFGGRPRPGVTKGELLASIHFERRMRLPTDLAGSGFTAKAAATAETVLSFEKAGTVVATATWSAAGSEAALAAEEDTLFEPGDELDIYAPAVRDDTLADISGWLALQPA